MALRKIIEDIRDALKVQQDQLKGSLADFKAQKQEASRMMLAGAIARLRKETQDDPAAYALAVKIENASPSEIPIYLDKLARIAAEEKTSKMRLPMLPAEIADEVTADLREIESCMGAKCYRSAMILCARVMETALHRRYFEATGQDLLEKAPGIGLGNLIAKLNERGVPLDPGLPNQIHLINQVRIFSVHTKQQAFVPSKMQAEAIVLYTMDILDKLFKKTP